MDAETDIRWMTYAELGRTRGISTASATRLSFRRKWRRQAGNDGIARVAVPVTEAQPRPDKDHEARDDIRGDDMGDIAHVIRVLETSVASLSERASTAEKRADRAEIRAESAETRANQAEQALAEERKRADQAQYERETQQTRADTLQNQLEIAEAKADAAEHDRAAAVAIADEAVKAAEELRKAATARLGQGRWARLRAAWRGE